MTDLALGQRVGLRWLRWLFHVLLLLTQLVTVVHKSITQFSNQLVALRTILDICSFMLRPILAGLLVCRRFFPSHFQQSRRPQECICFACLLSHIIGGPEQLVLVTRTTFSNAYRASRESQKTLECSHNSWICVPWSSCNQCRPNLVHING